MTTFPIFQPQIQIKNISAQKPKIKNISVGLSDQVRFITRTRETFAMTKKCPGEASGVKMEKCEGKDKSEEEAWENNQSLDMFVAINLWDAILCSRDM